MQHRPRGEVVEEAKCAATVCYRAHRAPRGVIEGAGLEAKSKSGRTDKENSKTLSVRQVEDRLVGIHW